MQLADRSDEEILSVVDPMMDNLMQASNENDHEMHVRDFTDRLRKLVSPDGLTRMSADFQSHFGQFTHRDLVGIFRRKNSIAVVWRQFASDSDNEFVADIVIIEQDGQYKIDHTLVY